MKFAGKSWTVVLFLCLVFVTKTHGYEVGVMETGNCRNNIVPNVCPSQCTETFRRAVFHNPMMILYYDCSVPAGATDCPGGALCCQAEKGKYCEGAEWYRDIHPDEIATYTGKSCLENTYTDTDHHIGNCNSCTTGRVNSDRTTCKTCDNEPGVTHIAYNARGYGDFATQTVQ